MIEFKSNIRTITDHNDICVSKYLSELSHYKLISEEEEAELAHTIKGGGKEAEKAKKRLIEANLRFVVSVANKFKTNKIPMEDLIAEGNVGLIRAVETFDPTRGFKFISYAIWWIRQAIMEAINSESTTLRLPSNQQRLLQRYKQLDRDMLQNEGRHLTIDEFSEATGISPEMASSIVTAGFAPIKMDNPLDDGSDCTFGDMMSSASQTDFSLERESLHDDLGIAIKYCLKDREADIVCRYFGFGCESSSFEDIAESYDLSRERTRQICLNALGKIRHSPYSNVLSAYLAA